MGIDGFHKWISSEYDDIYYDINDTNKVFHHLYIDLNYLLHLCHYNSNDETHLINKMSVVIMDICSKVCPVISLNLFCDGTAPFAKMVLQRERRNKNQNQNDDIFKTSLNFTPGTNFIKDMSIKLEKCIKTIRTYFNIKVNIDSIAPGEAEIKIKNKLIQNYNRNKDHSHLLVTNDADVVLILASDETYIKTNILLNNKVLPINELLIKHFNKYNPTFNKVNNLDFVLLSILLGNDYVPKIGELSPKKIWDSYQQNVDKYKYILKINKENDIKFEFNKDFLIDILNDCVGKIGKTKILKNNKLYCNELYKNYFDGILWTLTMYNLGRCYNYDYICNYNKPIDILNLILYLYDYDIKNFKFIETKPIPSVLCGILLLPENASKELIDKKYKKFIENKSIKKIYQTDFKITVEFIKNIQIKFEEFGETL